MNHATIISCAELATNLQDPDWVVVDVRFSLNDPGRGYRDYLIAHIPGAVYAHLDDDLSAPIIKGKTGRHPLPPVDVMAGRLGAWGIDDRVQVVAYDDSGGAMASRLWWMLRWLGHDAVAVLDGGFPQWRRENRPTVGDRERRAPRTFIPRPNTDCLVGVGEVSRMLNDPAWKLVDSRAPERFRGDWEPIDPVAGRIPGAFNAPHPEVLDPTGCFRSPEALRAMFVALLGDHPANRTVFYCGSGVSAAHNLLGFAHAGLGDGLLYPGSWSEWITDPTRPVARGP